jgi:hypothetical protein
VQILQSLLNVVPQLIGGLVILIAGWFIGGLLGRFVRRLASRAGAESLAQRAGIDPFLERIWGKEATTARVLGFIATWWIRILAIDAAVAVFGIPALSRAVDAILGYIPTVFAAVLILLAGAFLARIGREGTTAAATAGSLPVPFLLGLAAQALILFLTLSAVLQQLNVAATVAQDLLVAVLALIVGAGILGLGLAFGLGGRDAAARLIERAASGRTAERGADQQSSPRSDATS